MEKITKSLFVLVLLVGMALPAYGQEQGRTITGTVTDGDGAPVPGVTVVVKGTKTGTVIDLEGNNATTLSGFFNHDSPTRGRKGNEYNGGFHVPALASWPGHIAPNQVSDHIWAFWDFLPPVAEVAGMNRLQI